MTAAKVRYLKHHRMFYRLIPGYRTRAIKLSCLSGCWRVDTPNTRLGGTAKGCVKSL